MKECKHFRREIDYLPEDRVNICSIVNCIKCQKILYHEEHIWEFAKESKDRLDPIISEPIDFSVANRILYIKCKTCGVIGSITLRTGKPVLVEDRRHNDL